MKRNKPLLFITLLLTLCAGTAKAAPENGFSANFGFIHTNDTYTISTGLFAGTSHNYYGSGASFGIDYQFALGENFSLNPFLMRSAENVNYVALNATANHGILGLQARYWYPNGVYVGGLIGRYSESLINYDLNTTTSSSGTGTGLVAGWEDPAGGIYVQVILDTAKLNIPNTDTTFTSQRISAGYRWK